MCWIRLFLPLLSQNDLRSIIFVLKPNKAPGIDGVSINELRRHFDLLRHVLLSLLNNVILSGIMPIQMKTAVVTPLFKGGARKNIEHYRPISILPCISKVLEKHLYISKASFFRQAQYSFTSSVWVHSRSRDTDASRGFF